MNDVLKTLRWGAVLLLLGLLAGCGGEQARLDAEVEDFRLLREEDGTQIVRGVLFNPSTRPISTAQVEVALFQGSTEAAETIRFEVRDVAPGERKPFRQTVDTALELTGASVKQILIF